MSDTGRYWPTLLLACLAPALLLAQSAGLEVKRAAASKDSTEAWRTRAGGYDKDTYRSLTLAVRYLNLTGQDGSFTLEWHFLARAVDNKDLCIFESGATNISLKAGETFVSEIQSATLRESDVNVPFLGQRFQQGAKLEGYVVRVRLPDRLVAAAASSYTLETLARNPAEFDKLPRIRPQQSDLEKAIGIQRQLHPGPPRRPMP
jgi:hypothetical protein